MLIAMIICHTFVTDLIADSLVPHVLNVVQDTKNKYIPHRSRTYLLITSAWSIYCSVTQLFVIFIAFGQLDLLLVRLASDLFANFFTLNMYLDGKIYDPDLHAKNMSVNDNGRKINIDDVEEESRNDISNNMVNEQEEEEEDGKKKRSSHLGNKIKALVQMKIDPKEHAILYKRSEDQSNKDGEEIVELVFDNATEGDSAEEKTHDEKTSLLSSIDNSIVFNSKKRP